jgi:hypothetical protein
MPFQTPSLEDGVEGMTFMAAAIKSSTANGCWVELSEV